MLGLSYSPNFTDNREAYSPNFTDDREEKKWIKECKEWDKKIRRIKSDEKLVYIREVINYELERRSQEYIKEVNRVGNKRRK